MKRVFSILRGAVIGLLLVILAANVHLIGARMLCGAQNPALFGVSYSIVISGSMEPTFSAGDLLFYREQEAYAVGDVVIFSHEDYLVTHRIVGESEGGFITRGDANNTDDPVPVPPARISGKLALIVPDMGNAILFLRTPLGVFCLIVLGLLFWELPALQRTFQRKRGKYDATE